jgi:adenylylsulfate kinase
MNISPQEGEVSRADRQALLNQTSVTIWFTGISGAGKSSIAIALEKALHTQKRVSYRLDGDNLRLGLSKNLGFSETDRRENIRRVGEVAKLISDVGVIVLSSFISPYAVDRDTVRKLHEDSGFKFIEVYVDCSVTEAERRDPKGLYRKARAGEIENFTGVSHPYEAPIEPDIHLHTEDSTIEDEVSTIIDYLVDEKIIDSDLVLKS